MPGIRMPTNSEHATVDVCVFAGLCRAKFCRAESVGQVQFLWPSSCLAICPPSSTSHEQFQSRRGRMSINIFIRCFCPCLCRCLCTFRASTCIPSHMSVHMPTHRAEHALFRHEFDHERASIVHGHVCRYRCRRVHSDWHVA